MSEALKKLQNTKTGFRGVSDFKRMSVVSDFNQVETNNEYIGSEEYLLSVKLGTIYRVPNETTPRVKQEALEYAKTMIARELYKDVWASIATIRSLLFGDDKNGALEELSRLEEKIK